MLSNCLIYKKVWVETVSPTLDTVPHHLLHTLWYTCHCHIVHCRHAFTSDCILNCRPQPYKLNTQPLMQIFHSLQPAHKCTLTLASRGSPVRHCADRRDSPAEVPLPQTLHSLFSFNPKQPQGSILVKVARADLPRHITQG